MNSCCDAHAILARNTCDFNGGEICVSVGTVHNIVRLSKIDDDMNSSDARASLAQIPYEFNGGEICTSVGTVHAIVGFRCNDEMRQ